MVDKDNGDVCSLSATDPRQNCGLASALCSRMLPLFPGWAWLNRSCLAGTVVGWLANGAVLSSSPGKGRRVIQTIVLPRVLQQPQQLEQLVAALGSEAANEARSKKGGSLAAHCSSSGSSSNSIRVAAAAKGSTSSFKKVVACSNSSRQKGNKCNVILFSVKYY